MGLLFRLANARSGLDASAHVWDALTHNAMKEVLRSRVGKSNPYIVVASMGWGSPSGWKKAVEESKAAGPSAEPVSWAQ